MAQLDLQQVALKLATIAQAAGLEVHEEDSNGESYTRIQLGKKATDPKSFFQGVGGFILLNFPGSMDSLAVTAVNALTGNSPAPSPPLAG